MKKDDRTPLKDKPLRLPGQSLEEERRKLLDKMTEPLLGVGLIAGMTIEEWVRYYTKAPPTPWLFTFIALAAILYAAWVIYRQGPKLRTLRLGIEGERAVGQFLERLREQGYQVFHDVVGEGFNLDHVLIGPAGVFTVETKTWRKPDKGDARIHFDGEKLTAGSMEPDRNPVVQARAQASWLKTLLSESTGRRLEVRPVIVFPGWYVQNTEGSLRQLWVLEPKALPTFLKNEPQQLTPEDVKLASFHLSRFVRSVEKGR